MLVVIFKPPRYADISEITFNLVLPCIFAHFALQLSSWTHTYPFGLRGECWTHATQRVGVEAEQSKGVQETTWNMKPRVTRLV